MSKQIPLRMCTVCREMKPKAELIRVAKSPEGVVALDHTGKLPGRGAYLCRTGDCLQKAQKSRAFERAFRGSVPPEVYPACKEVPPDGRTGR